MNARATYISIHEPDRVIQGYPSDTRRYDVVPTAANLLFLATLSLIGLEEQTVKCALVLS
jgi:hypothetical protein